ncbi:Csu type fimbrial protein [Variovorax terrae]|uniref:Spore coat U domain-containing protein n=1 Tax=Variovorax terrae TaxID=2923278 RepID=A0A9X1VWQ5_9BURK|nr:spore coat U domain-containing protein [Variovorax terrae]MCJ0763292.1 spore coat U domain-containing protein [Variovorax terrae]
MRQLFRATLLSAVAAGAMVGAHAATDTANMTVKITVMAACSINAAAPTDVDFGSAISTATNVSSVGGVLTVNCTNGSAYNIGLDNGLNYNATTRRMKTVGSNYVSYGLFQDVGHTTAWGNTVGTDTRTGSGTGTNQTYTVYGLVPNVGGAPAGNYTDTVIATLTY